MGTKVSPVKVADVDILGGDDDVDDVSILLSPPPVASRLRRRRGTNKGNAISVENYCNSMAEHRDLQIIDSFNFKNPNRKPFPRRRGISSYEAGQSSHSPNPNPSIVIVDIDNDKNDSASQIFFCEICFDQKLLTESFRIQGCNHSYCSDCIHQYVASKIQDNISQINCPVSGCKGVLEPEYCRSILPPEVFDRWGETLCEAVILACHKFYCPFKDCSALLIQDEGNNGIVESECPVCRRLFCAQCKVPWHSGIVCGEFQRLHKDEREREDILLMQLAKYKNWMRCPKCKFYVEKSEGCLFMKCRCGHTFCYNCGAPLSDHYCSRCKH